MSAMKEAVAYAIEAARKRGLSAEVSAFELSSTMVGMQERKVDQFTFSDTREVGARVVRGDHEGVAYSESLDRGNLDEMLAEAEANSRMIKRPEPPTLSSIPNLPSMDFIHNPALDNVDMELKLEAAARLESAARDFDPRVSNVDTCRYRDRFIRKWLANTNGVMASYQANWCAAHVSCMARDGDAAVQASDSSFARDLSQLDLDSLGRSAAARTVSRLGARRPQSGRYTIVLENRVAENLVEILSAYFSAKAVAERHSPLDGKLGQAVFSSRFSLVDDPFLTLGTASRPFDDEGYESHRVDLVEGGIIRNFLTNSVFAKKMSLPHTAHGSRSPSTELGIESTNLVVKPGAHTLADLLNTDHQVLLVTSVLGTAGLRASSGDFSLPVEGFLYENGRPVHALRDFLISGNLLNLFARIDGVGNDVKPPGGQTRAISPSLLVREVNVAGRS